MLIGERILVVGAGIAGLAVARALALRGAKVTVIEASAAAAPKVCAGAEPDGQGGGLQISPNGVKVLDALGLGAAARQGSVQSQAVQLLDGFTGRGITRLDLRRHREAGLDYLLFRRGELTALLAAGARELGVEIRTGLRLDWPVPVAVSGAEAGGASGSERGTEIGPDFGRGFGRAAGAAPESGPETGRGTGARILRGAPGAPLRLVTAAGAEDYPLVLAADGFHSGARALLNGPEAAEFSGQIAWRAVVRDSAAPETRAFLGPGMHLVSYPLPGGLRNIAAFEEQAEWRAEGWHHPAHPAAFRSAFSSFCPEVGALLEKVEQVRVWGLFLRPVAAQWQDGGSLALLGDAAHPTLPYMAQGANMALEDAWLLAEALARHPKAEALARWQALRQPRVRRAIAMASANARNYHLRGLMRYGAHKVLKIGGLLVPGLALRQFDWLYRMDVTAIEP